MQPALCTKISTLPTLFLISSATRSRSFLHPISPKIKYTSLLLLFYTIYFTASSPLCGFLHTIKTLAFFEAAKIAADNPNPLLAPVMT